ncbi:UUP1 family membrane protein [Elongatibacter sediminis]|uniref:UUP1 family membrane protein n=1 Tax=Elongatibacter sediminis TaxID=3119006 RepID=A0AAW9RJQ8_9GAMM
MKRNRQWVTLSLLLMTLGGLIFAYKVIRLGYPPYPDLESVAWTVQARLQLEPEHGAVRASLLLPARPSGYTVAQENFVSRGFGLTLEEQTMSRRADWAVRRLREPGSLYYRALVIPDTRERSFASRPAYPSVPELEEPHATALLDLIEVVRAESADTETFAAAMIERLNRTDPDENADLFLADVASSADRVRVAQTLLAGARIPTLQIHGIRLGEDTQRADFETLLAVFNGEDWLVFDPATGTHGLPEGFFIWWTGDQPPVTVSGAKLDDLQISTRHRVKSALDIAQQRAELQHSSMRLISTLQFPVQTQSVYEILLLIPIGILVIVLLRNFVGFSSFGTFAPVLIALAFRETELFKGIILFILIVSLGLFFRFYMERLRLLLVPRLAAVVTIVVLLMTAISIISNEFGMETGLSVSLFPMVIISMVIERMSVVWEERGAYTSIKEGLGSLLMAALAYLAMSVDQFAYWVTVFPEVNLIVLGVIIALGRYTGFRLTELRRFRSLATVVDEDGRP